MKTWLPSIICLAIIGLGIAACAAETAPTTEKKYPDPKRHEKEIIAFEAADKEQMPPKGAIVCVGSSSMRGWHKWIVEDLAPLTVIPRGFGGSNMYDAVFLADRVVTPYSPRAIVLYEGDNDVAGGFPAEKTLETFREFVKVVRKKLPKVRIYVLSVKPSPRRWELWPKMQETNKLLKQECDRRWRMEYIDITASMLDSTGQPFADIFLTDNLHMNRKGYELWRDDVRPVLLKAEQKYEKQADKAAPSPNPVAK